jgi:hypothetical protein
MKKYYVIFDDENNIINQPAEYAPGTAIVTNYNFMIGRKDVILSMFPEAVFPEEF